jgi:four helix bundle protein
VNKQELQNRTKAFALRVMEMIDCLPRTVKGRVIADQIMRSATSVAANYRVACRARSTAEFIAKIGTVLEEVDESAFWLDLIAESGLLPAPRLAALAKEADELSAIMFTAQRTARRNVKS